MLLKYTTFIEQKIHNFKLVVLLCIGVSLERVLKTGSPDKETCAVS